jgi:hypothetical protein
MRPLRGSGGWGGRNRERACAPLARCQLLLVALPAASVTARDVGRFPVREAQGKCFAHCCAGRGLTACQIQTRSTCVSLGARRALAARAPMSCGGVSASLCGSYGAIRVGRSCVLSGSWVVRAGGSSSVSMSLFSQRGIVAENFGALRLWSETTLISETLRMKTAVRFHFSL